MHACGGPSATSQPPPSHDTPAGDNGGPPPAAAGDTPPPRDGAARPQRPASSPPRAEPGEESPGPPTAAPSASSDGGPIGDRAATYLRGDVPALVVEIDAISGETPTRSATSHLKDVLTSVLTKSGGIEVAATQTIPRPSSSRYRIEDLRALEAKHRQTATDERRASMYFLYVNGTFADAPSALAVAYTASAVAIFSEQIDGAVTALVARAAIERAVLVHEAGHLMRLVNIGYRSPRDHEDPQRPNHSKNRNSVMYWAVEDLSVGSLLSGGPPDDFDADDRADLADLKAGRL